MPKYIRTEKGIYEVVEDSNKEWGKQIVVKFPKNLNMKLADVKDQIIKQANTIEELCDEFVYEKGCGANRGKPMISKNDFKSLSEWYVDYGFKVNTVYGAIWTDKGLIYVAKMNDKGELELI